ncbi:tetratricopeptide repeat protein [Pontibacter sp. MBLB2868]|uniref:tetratricopeptide repeat protein n=1 Tax=Pontibacter sp. MBLB2868 TaxID=3451555 RepID=UPI003F750CFE
MAQPHPFFLMLLLLILSNSNSSAATSSYSSTISKAHQEYLKLKIASGNYYAKEALNSTPSNAAALLVNNYGDFLTLCVQQDASVYEALITQQENRLAKIGALAERSAWRDYALAEVRMQVGLSKLLFGNKLSAAWDIRQAYLQYDANAKKYPEFIPNKKTLGVLQVLIGSVPDKYKWFLNIIGMKGSVRVGMANLRAAAFNSNPFQEEAKVIYALTLQLTDQGKDDQAVAILEKIVDQEPDNLLYRFAAIHLLKKTKHTDQALEYYTERPQNSQYLTFPYLRHMAADLYLYKGLYEKSARENQAFLKQHKGDHYIKAANYKLYLAYYLSNHQPQALWYYKQISEAGIQVIEEDKYAARFVEKQEKPEKHLLISRLRSDGGYYQQALKALDEVDTTSNSPLAIRAEYMYRKARIYHGMEDKLSAIKFYKSAIDLCGYSDLYFAPHAALQLGYIYEELNKKELAKVYFKKAMAYQDHEYKSSIDAKAKLALSAL